MSRATIITTGATTHATQSPPEFDAVVVTASTRGINSVGEAVVGAAVGAIVGASVGAAVGADVGACVGADVGASVPVAGAAKRQASPQYVLPNGETSLMLKKPLPPCNQSSLFPEIQEVALYLPPGTLQKSLMLGVP